MDAVKKEFQPGNSPGLKIIPGVLQYAAGADYIWAGNTQENFLFMV